MAHLPRNDEDLARSFELMSEIRAFLRPHVEPLSRRRFDETLRDISVSEEHIRLLSRAIGELLFFNGATCSEVKEAMKQVRKDFRDPDAMDAAMREESCSQSVDGAVAAVAAIWLETVIQASLPMGPLSYVESRTIGDDMLPPLGETVLAIMTMLCQETPFSVDEMRDILKAAQAALPDGKKLPAQAMEFLDLFGVLVLN